MPDPKKYKNQKDFMNDCMHTTVHEEGKSREQGVAQCLNMWRQKNKVATEFLKAMDTIKEPKVRKLLT